MPCVLADGTRVYLYKRRTPNNSTLGGANGTSDSDGSSSGMSSPVAKTAGSISRYEMNSVYVVRMATRISTLTFRFLNCTNNLNLVLSFSPLTSKTLLSKSMVQLMREADALKVIAHIASCSILFTRLLDLNRRNFKFLILEISYSMLQY